LLAQHTLVTGSVQAWLIFLKALMRKEGASMLRETSHLKTLPTGVQAGTCENCGLGKMELVEERPHPMLGIAGKTLLILKCNAADCGTYLVKST
jgi:hypothetical protein